MTTLNDLNGYLDDEAYTVRVGELRALLSASIADTAGANTQDAIAIAKAAINAMTEFHAQAEPDDTPDMNPTFPAEAFRKFVDEHARLMFRVSKHESNPTEPAYLRLREAAQNVAAVLGYHGEINGRDDRVQALLDALYETDDGVPEKAKPVRADTAGANCATCGAVGTVTSTKARCTLCGMFADTAGAKPDNLQEIVRLCRLFMDDESGKYNAQSMMLRIFGLAIAATPASSVADAPAKFTERERFVWNLGYSAGTDRAAHVAQKCMHGKTYEEHGRTNWNNGIAEAVDAIRALAPEAGSCSVADAAGASEGQANLWARADYPVTWARHGSGINEWWSRDGYEARKTVSGRWVLSRAGLPIFEHEYLQEVMDRAFVLTQDAASEIAALRERIAGMEKDAEQRHDNIRQIVCDWFRTSSCLKYALTDIDAAIAKEPK